jgi:hypothetical protein
MKTDTGIGISFVINTEALNGGAEAVKQASLQTTLNVQASQRMTKDGRASDLKTFVQTFIGSIAIGTASLSLADSYDRKDFNYRSYKPNTSIGFYTGQSCDFINIDHVVSLKDAYDSGAASRGVSKKESFANDRDNHVPSCGPMNSSKGSAGPSDFLRRSRDGRGLEYEIVRFCEYVQKYYAVKVKYGFSLEDNDSATFERCGIPII